MQTEIDFYLERLDEKREAVREALLGLDADGLNWKPIPEGTNSIYNLAQHCAWVEQWWIGSVLAGKPFPRPWIGDEELEGRGEDASELLFWLDEGATSSKAELQGLSVDALAETRVVPRADGSERTVSVHWTIVHTIEHYAEHIGQMRLTRQLWEAQKR